jgi:glycosyltransferase involved in cell wall biosynthesis
VTTTCAAPCVTVVIPTFNRAHFLPSAVRSAQSQTLREIEIVIVDDGSTDDTPSVCRELAASDQRVRVLRQENRGLAAARNAGLGTARSEWVAFLDDDDLWVQQALEALLARVDSVSPAVVSLALGFVSPDPDVTAAMVIGDPRRFQVAPLSLESPSDPIELRDLLMRPYFPPHAALSQVRLLKSLGGFDESRSAAEDYDMWLRLAAQTPIRVVEQRLALYRWHPGQMSAILERQARETRLVLERFLTSNSSAWDLVGRGAMRRRLAFLAREEAYAGLLAGNFATARAAAAASVKLRPLGAKSWVYLLLSATPRLHSRFRRLLRGLSANAC